MNKSFLRILLKRILSSLITLLLLISFLFILIRLSPGDPTQKYLSAKFSPELKTKIAEDFDLNRPVLSQYTSFLLNIFKGDLGVSYDFRQPVLSVIWQFFSFTLVFAFLSFIIQLLISYLLAISSVQKSGNFFDRAIAKSSIIIYATPAFVLGVFLIFLLSVHIDLFPSSGLKSPDHDSLSFLGKTVDYFKHLVLPLITLSAAGTAMFYKYLRENMEDVYNRNYILQLRASGYTEKVILKKHVIPNAVRPLISIAGIELGMLLGGALITEVIFGLPGMGRLMMDSIFSRDYPLVIGCALVGGFMMIFSNFVADLVKIKIDKRMIKGLMN
jgi:peptide/nickel transport system permease protein